MNRWGTLQRVGVAAITTVLVACGYHFTGGGSLPAGVTQVFVPIFENRSSVSGLESLFTNDLMYEFTRTRKESIAKNQVSADGILRGTIVTLTVENISRASVTVATQRRVTGIVKLQMESQDGRTIWASGDIVESFTYSVVNGNKTATDQNKLDAIAVISKKTAESAFARFTDDF